jgi:hypothetical protein
LHLAATLVTEDLLLDYARQGHLLARQASR